MHKKCTAPHWIQHKDTMYYYNEDGDDDDNDEAADREPDDIENICYRF